MALGKNLSKKESPKVDKVDADPVLSKRSESEKKSSKSEEIQEAEIKKLQYCVFKCGSEFYGIPIELVKEVVASPEITALPQMPKYILGMVNVRGNIYGILDLNSFFQNEKLTTDEKSYLLLLEHEDYQVAITIPQVPDTVMTNESDIEDLPTSRLKSTTGQKYLRGVIKKDQRMIILFDILGMVSSDKFTQVN
ncbi:MAG: chemotaxis protein CheW [Bacteroidota bacterium]